MNKQSLLNYRRYLPIVMILLFFFGCRKEDQNGQEDENQKGPVTKVQIQDAQDTIVVDFPSGSIKSTKVTLTKTKDTEIENVFNETSNMFGVSNRLPYQIVLNIGQDPPLNDSIKISIWLPPDFRNSLPQDHGFELFAQIYDGGEMETLDFFDIIESEYNPNTHKLVATVPTWIFTNKRNVSGNHEAVFMVGTTPGVNIYEGRLSRARRGIDEEKCEAGQISCPLGSVDVCTEKAGDPYGIRVDPITGKKGTKHWGIDYKVPIGTPVHSVSDGVIETVKLNGYGYGDYIIVRHSNSKSATLYAHLSNIGVKVGDKIKANQEIGKSGNSGSRTTGAHLHFEYVPNGKIIRSKSRINPSPCITAGNAEGSITVRDNGNWADDAFELYLDNDLIGNTEVGGQNSIALSNLRPGDKTLKLVCNIAPDNEGTYEVLLNDGILFKEGGDRQSGVIPQNGSISWGITIPRSGRPSGKSISSRLQPNKHIEK